MTDQECDSVLLPPPETKGGLIKPAKKNPTASEHVFKAPEPFPSRGNYTL